MMPGAETSPTSVYDLPVEDITPEALDKLFLHYQPEARMAQELWPHLSLRARSSLLDRAHIGDFDWASELMLMYAVEEGIVVPQWVIDAGDTLAKDWGWSPNVEKACAALQARLDEHNRGGGE